jgi:hypothetical protein
LRAERNILADRVAELEETNRKLYALVVEMSVLVGDNGFAESQLARAEMEGAPSPRQAAA